MAAFYLYVQSFIRRGWCAKGNNKKQCGVGENRRVSTVLGTNHRNSARGVIAVGSLKSGRLFFLLLSRILLTERRFGVIEGGEDPGELLPVLVRTLDQIKPDFGISDEANSRSVEAPAPQEARVSIAASSKLNARR
jgi:hypothetical protein